MLQGASAEQQTQDFVEGILTLTFDMGVKHRGFLDEPSLQGYLEPWREEPAAFFRAARAISGRGLSGRDRDLGALDIPIFLIWGEDDPFLPPELAERLQDTMEGSTLALLPGCSHFITDDAPTTVGPLINEFLRTRYLGRSHTHGEPVPVFLERPHSGS